MIGVERRESKPAFDVKREQSCRGGIKSDVVADLETRSILAVGLSRSREQSQR